MADDDIFIAIDTVKFAAVGCDDIDPVSELNVKSTTIPQDWDLTGGARIGDVREFMANLLDDGKVKDVRAEYDSLSRELIIDLELTPILNGVVFSGDRVLHDSLLAKPFTDLAGSRLNYLQCEEALEQVLRVYRSRGYPAARIASVSLDESTGILHVDIDIGRLEMIDFSGLKRTSRSWLSREIPIRPGEPLTRAEILKGTSNLFATGLFRSVYPVLEYNGNGSGWRLRVIVSEQPALPVRLGLAYLDERRVRGFFELVYPNPYYYASRLTVYAALGQYDNEYKLKIIADRILGLPITCNVDGGFDGRERRQFDVDHKSTGSYTEEKTGARFEFGGQAPSWGLMSITSRFEKHDNGYSTSRLRYDLAAFGIKLALDTQDRTPFPKNGIRLSAACESAAKLGSDDDFSRIWGNWEGFVTPVRRHTFGARFSAATADRTTPPDEHFRLGGMDSFPGLHLDEKVGPMQLSAGLETRYDLISRFLADTYIGLRCDVAGSWDDPQAQITRRDWMTSTAIYFAFDTLLGPLKLQYEQLFAAGAVKPQSLISLQAGNNF
jgi:outer membrane protein assembly factor BamA